MVASSIANSKGEFFMEAVKANQAEWLEYWSRRNCIGSSDIKSIVGTCSFRGPHDVQVAKTDENYEDKRTTYMEVGEIMEPALGVLVRRKLHYHGIDVVLKPAKTYTREVDGVRLRDTPDFIAVESNLHRKPLYVIETKTGYSADRELYGDEWTDDVFEGYFPNIYVIKSDSERFDYLVKSGVGFWKRYVEGDETPAADATSGCRKNLARLAEKRHNLIDATDEQADLARELKKLKAEIKAMGERATKIENGFIKDIGEYKGIDFFDGAKFTYTTNKNGKRTMRASLKTLEMSDDSINAV
jgi:hypothetical protein